MSITSSGTFDIGDDDSDYQEYELRTPKKGVAGKAHLTKKEAESQNIMISRETGGEKGWGWFKTSSN